MTLIKTSSIRFVCIPAFLMLALSGCAKENSVTDFLSDSANKLNSIDTRISGSESTATLCRPSAYVKTIGDPAPQFVGRTFTYQRGQYARGKVSYSADGTLAWENDKGTKSGTGNWAVKGRKWCESFNASEHNAAVSQRCWPVINESGALCFGVSRLVPAEGRVTLY